MRLTLGMTLEGQWAILSSSRAWTQHNFAAPVSGSSGATPAARDAGSLWLAFWGSRLRRSPVGCFESSGLPRSSAVPRWCPMSCSSGLLALENAGSLTPGKLALVPTHPNHLSRGYHRGRGVGTRASSARSNL